MAPSATERQYQILGAVRELTAERGFPPTLHELSERLGMAAPGGAASGVKSLVAKGLLSVEKRTSRSMQLTAEGASALSQHEGQRAG